MQNIKDRDKAMTEMKRELKKLQVIYFPHSCAIMQISICVSLCEFSQFVNLSMFSECECELSVS